MRIHRTPVGISAVQRRRMRSLRGSATGRIRPIVAYGVAWPAIRRCSGRVSGYTVVRACVLSLTGAQRKSLGGS